MAGWLSYRSSPDIKHIPPAMKRIILVIFLGAAFVAADANGQAFFFSTGNPDGKMATASRPGTASGFELESADDFVLTDPTQITSATFTGLLQGNLSAIGELQVEIYRVFPNDSDVGRSSGPPTFSTPQVPTRVNSPSDVALDSRNSLAAGGVSFTTTDLGSFTVLNSIQAGGIHPLPGVQTGGNGPVTGEEVQFNLTFTTPFDLAAGHYFFVPQVEVAGGNFLWLSAPKPIVAPGTSFPAGSTDLQAWTRDAELNPDWLREGTDIVGGTLAPTFNQVFSLGGTVPDSGSTALLLGSAAAVLFYLRRRIRAGRSGE
jgi:hypothetical protein